MKSLPVSVLLALSLATTSVAQVGVGFSKLPSPSSVIINSFNVIPGNDLRQIQHVKLSNNPAGTWTSAITVGGLPFFLGGDDISVGVAIGTFDPYNGVFQVGFDAANLNSTDDEVHVTLSPDGLWAVVERHDPMTGNLIGVFLGHRNAVAMPFNAPVQVTGLPGGLQNMYPAVAPVRGAMKLFYSNGADIVVQDINLQTATVSGTPVVVHHPVQAGAVAISPTPVIGADGDAEALWTADLVVPRPNGDSDPVWANDLDPSTPGVIQVQRTDYQCCGGLAGGFINFTHDILPRWHVMHAEGAWLAGDDEAVGGTANIRTAAPNYSAPKPLISTLFLSTGESSAPLTLPMINGGFALNPAVVVQVATFSTTSKDGVADTSFGIPNNNFLRGKSLALQAVVADLTTGVYSLTNTAWLHMR